MGITKDQSSTQRLFFVRIGRQFLQSVNYKIIQPLFDCPGAQPNKYRRGLRRDRQQLGPDVGKFLANNIGHLLTAEGGTNWNHAVAMARSRRLTGPYELHPDTHLMSARHRPDAPLQRFAGAVGPCAP